MPIALITADSQRHDGKQGEARLLAGRSVLHHQLDLALSAGCDRIICLADHQPIDLARLREACAAAGARLRLLHRPQELLALVSTRDTLLVLAPHALVDAELLRTTGSAPTVLAVPADPAVAMGFERIDATRAWAGVMMVGSKALEGIQHLPGDIAAPSALLRMALMTGTPIRELPLSVLTDGTVSLPRDEGSMREVEARRIARVGRPVSFAAPVRAIIERAAIRLTPRVLASRNGIVAATSAALAALSAALLAAQSRWTAAALLLMAFVFAVVTGLKIVRRVADSSRPGETDRLSLGMALMADLALALILASGGEGQLNLSHVHAALMLIGLLHLAKKLLPDRWALFTSDRVAMIPILVGAHLLGVLQTSMMLMAVVLLLALLLFGTRTSTITTD